MAFPKSNLRAIVATGYKSHLLDELSSTYVRKVGCSMLSDGGSLTSDEAKRCREARHDIIYFDQLCATSAKTGVKHAILGDILENEAIRDNIPLRFIRKTEQSYMVVETIYPSDQCSNNYFRKIEMIKWEKPPVGIVKINTNGGAYVKADNASFGGLARNHEGLWLEGFYANIGAATSIQADLRGILHSFKLAKERGWSYVVVETNSLGAAEQINNMTIKHSAHKLMVDQIRCLKYDLQGQLVYIKKEANPCASLLSSLGLQLKEVEEVKLIVPPEILVMSLKDDARGFEVPRGYSAFGFNCDYSSMKIGTLSKFVVKIHTSCTSRVVRGTRRKHNRRILKP